VLPNPQPAGQRLLAQALFMVLPKTIWVDNFSANLHAPRDSPHLADHGRQGQTSPGSFGCPREDRFAFAYDKGFTPTARAMRCLLRTNAGDVPKETNLTAE